MIILPNKYIPEMLSIGSLSPDFNLASSDGNFRGLYYYRGSFVVLYFYPNDNLNRSISEMKLFRDKYKFFREYNIILFVISEDMNDTVVKFSLKYAIPFPILSDDNREVASKYKVFNKDSKIIRTTFLVNKDSKILNIWRDKKLKNYYEEIFSEVEKNT
jgi:peroxiredoxin Q/BCP